MSNNGNTGSTLDINSGWFISEDDNYGILNVSGTVSTFSNNMYYSTAACGHQIQETYRFNELDQYNVCDKYYLDNWMYKDNGGGFHLSKAMKPQTAESIDEAMVAGNRGVLGQVSAELLEGGSSMQSAASALLASRTDKGLAARMLVGACLSRADLQAAKSFLMQPELAGINRDLRTVLELSIAYAANGTLHNGQAGTLAEIDAANNEYSALARDLIHVNAGDHDYKFKRLSPADLKHPDASAKTISRYTNSLRVTPVPASNMITLEHNVSDGNVNGVRILSASGVEVGNITTNMRSGKLNIDISSLADGVYSVMLITDNEKIPVLTARFVKLR
jgi:hypothetical protein